MALDTYTNLQTAIGTLLNRNDLTTVIPDWIALVEAELQRVLEGQPMRTLVAVTFTTSGTVALPTDYRSGEALTLEVTGQGIGLDIVPYPTLIAKRQQYVSGAPLYASVVGTNLLLAPIPDSDTAYTGHLLYDALLTPLSVANPTNWALTSHPDVYLYGAAAHSAPYLIHDERLPMWRQLFQQALDQVRIARDRAEYGANTPRLVPPRVLGDW